MYMVEGEIPFGIFAVWRCFTCVYIPLKAAAVVDRTEDDTTRGQTLISVRTQEDGRGTKRATP